MQKLLFVVAMSTVIFSCNEPRQHRYIVDQDRPTGWIVIEWGEEDCNAFPVVDRAVQLDLGSANSLCTSSRLPSEYERITFVRVDDGEGTLSALGDGWMRNFTTTDPRGAEQSRLQVFWYGDPMTRITESSAEAIRRFLEEVD